jgi:hypothetical protein
VVHFPRGRVFVSNVEYEGLLPFGEDEAEKKVTLSRYSRDVECNDLLFADTTHKTFGTPTSTPLRVGVHLRYSRNGVGFACDCNDGCNFRNGVILADLVDPELFITDKECGFFDRSFHRQDKRLLQAC